MIKKCLVVQWLTAISILLPRAYLQMSMQIYKMPPLYALPAPLPLPLPPPPPSLPALSFQIALPMSVAIGPARPSTTTTTTTITERSVAIAFPIQLPFPVQVAIPAQPPPDFCLKRPRPYNCPVCPPCLCTPCTPAFFSFCSPCHQKCRCRDRKDVPEPLPHVAPVPVAGPAYPVAIPGPFMGPSSYVVPFHEKHRQRDGTYEAIDESCSDSFEQTSNNKRRKKGKRPRSYRRNFISSNSNDEDLLRPVLSYLTGDGVVKMEKPLSDAEAEKLLDDSFNQKVYVTVDEDSENRQSLHVVSRSENGEQNGNQPNNHRHRQVYLAGSAQHMLAEGMKKLVFTPPANKKISNLSVSFKVV